MAASVILLALISVIISSVCSDSVNVDLSALNNSKCGSENVWIYQNIPIAYRRDNSKALQASSFSCASFPIKLDSGGTLTISVYVDGYSDNSRLQVLLQEDDVIVLNYNYNKFNKDFEEGWHTISLNIEQKVNADVTLLGFSEVHDVIIIDSIQLNTNKQSLRETWTQNFEDVQIINLVPKHHTKNSEVEEIEFSTIRSYIESDSTNQYTVELGNDNNYVTETTLNVNENIETLFHRTQNPNFEDVQIINLVPKHHIKNSEVEEIEFSTIRSYIESDSTNQYTVELGNDNNYVTETTLNVDENIQTLLQRTQNPNFEDVQIINLVPKHHIKNNEVEEIEFSTIRSYIESDSTNQYIELGDDNNYVTETTLSVDQDIETLFALKNQPQKIQLMDILSDYDNDDRTLQYESKRSANKISSNEIIFSTTISNDYDTQFLDIILKTNNNTEIKFNDTNGNNKILISNDDQKEQEKNRNNEVDEKNYEDNKDYNGNGQKEGNNNKGEENKNANNGREGENVSNGGGEGENGNNGTGEGENGNNGAGEGGNGNNGAGERENGNNGAGEGENGNNGAKEGENGNNGSEEGENGNNGTGEGENDNNGAGEGENGNNGAEEGENGNNGSEEEENGNNGAGEGENGNNGTEEEENGNNNTGEGENGNNGAGEGENGNNGEEGENGNNGGEGENGNTGEEEEENGNNGSGEGENGNNGGEEGENDNNSEGGNSNENTSFWNIWTIVLVSVASATLLVMVTVGAYCLGKIRGRDVIAPIDISDLEAPRIIPRAKNIRPPYERFGASSEYGGSN